MNDNIRKFVTVAVALVYLSTVVAGPALAQDNGSGIDSNITTGNGTLVDDGLGTNNSSAPTNNSSSNNSSSGGGGGGGGSCGVQNLQGCFPDLNLEERIGGLITPVLDGFANWLFGIIQEPVSVIAGWVVELINGIPAPGDMGNPLTWNPALDANGGNGGGDPANSISAPREQAGGIWNDVYQLWIFSMMISMLILLISGSWIIAGADPYEKREYGIKWITALIMSVLTWFVAPLILHITRALSLGIAPDAIELSTNIADFGLGILLGLVLILFAFGIFLGAAITLFAEYFLAHFLVGIWPLLWSLRTTNESTLESIGNSGLYAFGLVCVLYVVQAIVLRFTFALDFAASGMSISSGIFAFAATMVGLYIGLVRLPRSLLQRALSAGVIGLGTSRLRRRPMRRGSGLYDQKDKLGNAWEKTKTGGAAVGGAVASGAGRLVPSRGTRNEDASPNDAVADGGRPGDVTATQRGGARGNSSTDSEDIDYVTRDEYPGTNSGVSDNYSPRDSKSSYRDSRSKEGRFVGRTNRSRSRRNRRNGRQSARRRRGHRDRSTPIDEESGDSGSSGGGASGDGGDGGE